ncbi:hypothetical protein JTB14_007664 [Gonioctena quinquepunctata]|nr:hypothetical protein JTB14_007664 [Gonioctena quinquepunctata]
MNKLVGEFMKHINKQEAVFTSQVYLEVCEVKRYHEVQYFYNAEINKIVITAKKTKSGPTCAFIPTTVYENLTFLRLQSFVSTNPYEINYLVIVYSDSTCVYYELSNGLIEPTDTSAKHLKENKQDKLDSDLRKHRELVEQAALMGLAVSIKKN